MGCGYHCHVRLSVRGEGKGMWCCRHGLSSPRSSSPPPTHLEWFPSTNTIGIGVNCSEYFSAHATTRTATVTHPVHSHERGRGDGSSQGKPPRTRRHNRRRKEALHVIGHPRPQAADIASYVQVCVPSGPSRRLFSGVSSVLWISRDSASTSTAASLPPNENRPRRPVTADGNAATHGRMSMLVVGVQRRAVSEPSRDSMASDWWQGSKQQGATRVAVSVCNRVSLHYNRVHT